MLLTIPTAILVTIILVIVFLGLLAMFAYVIYTKKQKEDIKNQPEEIKKKSDAPEMPSEGQEDKPIM
jgi:flagellar basal body-associated protein FliL